MEETTLNFERMMFYGKEIRKEMGKESNRHENGI